MKKQLRRTVSALLSGCMLFSVTSMLPASTAYAATCTVDPGTKYQEIKGFGGINLPEWQAINLPSGTTADLAFCGRQA